MDRGAFQGLFRTAGATQSSLVVLDVSRRSKSEAITGTSALILVVHGIGAPKTKVLADAGIGLGQAGHSRSYEK